MIKWIIIAIIGLIILGNLGFDIQKSIKSPVTQSNLEYVKEILIFIWTKYLAEPIKFLWRELFIKFIIDPLRNSLDNKVQKSANITNTIVYFA